MILNQDYLSTLARSPTFIDLLRGEVLYCLVMLAALLYFVVRTAKRIHPKELHRDAKGSATAVDFVLVIPVFLAVIAVVVQLALVVHTSLIVHYAAYSAARSAMIQYWNHDVWLERGGQYLGAAQGSVKFNALRVMNEAKAKRRAEAAARYVLIAASPVSPRVPTQAGTLPGGIIKRISTVYVSTERAAVLRRQARYAYDPDNLRMVNVSPAVSSNHVTEAVYLYERTQSANAWPVTIELEYRMHLGVPFGAMIGDRDGGRYYKWIDAEVTLL